VRRHNDSLFGTNQNLTHISRPQLLQDLSDKSAFEGMLPKRDEVKMENLIRKQIKTAIAAISITVSVSVLVSCNYNDTKNQPTSLTKTGTPNGTPQAAVDYQTVKTLVFDQACIKCHGSTLVKGGVRLDTYALAFATVDRIRTEVEAGDMPPPPPRGATLSDEQKALLFAWLDSGAPETTVVTQPPTSPPTTPPTVPPTVPTPPTVPPTVPGPSPSTPDFAMVSQAVFVPHCVKCHGATMTKGGVNLEAYANAARHAQEIADSLDTDDMPRKAPPLDPTLKAIVYAWIDAGAPENVAPGSPPTVPGPAPVEDGNGNNNSNHDGHGAHHGRGRGRGHGQGN
jgi:mono/diheme cytochrome c family protein